MKCFVRFLKDNFWKSNFLSKTTKSAFFRPPRKTSKNGILAKTTNFVLNGVILDDTNYLFVVLSKTPILSKKFGDTAVLIIFDVFWVFRKIIYFVRILKDKIWKIHFCSKTPKSSFLWGPQKTSFLPKLTKHFPMGWFYTLKNCFS